MKTRPTATALVHVSTRDKNGKGVKIYWGTTTRVYSSSKDIGLAWSYRVQGLQHRKKYYFSAKCYNDVGQSVFGNEAAYVTT